MAQRAPAERSSLKHWPRKPDGSYGSSGDGPFDDAEAEAPVAADSQTETPSAAADAADELTADPGNFGGVSSSEPADASETTDSASEAEGPPARKRR